MHLRTSVFVFMLALLSGVASAQNWAKAMFDTLDHDFGAVARGSDTVYRFEVTNKYQEDIRLLSVRSSCGCTSPSIETKDWIKTWGKGYVVAKFNTRTFTGIHSATLTVDIEVKGKGTTPTFRGQVQLRVHGNIRGDVVFEPGAVVFGEVDQGEQREKRVSVSYSGRSSWKINDVRSASDNLEVELTERRRRGGRVVYDLLTRLKSDATPGVIKEQLVIVTNDGATPRVPIDVEGRVIPEISVAPEYVVFGKVPEGEIVSKRIIVRGKKPFKITSIECEDTCLAFKADERESDRHIVEVTFNAACKPGDKKAPIVIHTDRGESFTATCIAYATVEKQEPDAEVASADQGASAQRGPGGELVKE